MSEVLTAKISVNEARIGKVTIKYSGLIVNCQICLYKDQNLYIRMPEFRGKNSEKIKFAYWESKELSDQQQELILKKVFDLIGLDLEMAIKVRNEYKEAQKELTKQKNKPTLDKKTIEA